MKLTETLQAGRVQRYHAAPVDKKQSVAEHSWGVAMILLEICFPSKSLLKAALIHDAAEYYTGDLPSPVKRVSPEVKELFDALEDDGLALLELIMPDLDARETRLLKIADCLEGMYYCDSRIQAGDNGAIKVRDNYITYLNKLGWNVEEMCDESE